MITKAPPGVDMSPKAIDRRLQRLSGLYQLTTTFKNIKWLGKAKGCPHGVAKDLDAISGGADLDPDALPLRV